MIQENLFDGRALADEAIERVGAAADPDWKQEAAFATYRVAQRLEYFTTDDIWDELEELEISVSTHERRAMGHTVTEARKDGICLPTGRHVPSRRRIRHVRPLMVWRSLIFKEQNGEANSESAEAHPYVAVRSAGVQKISYAR